MGTRSVKWDKNGRDENWNEIGKKVALKWDKDGNEVKNKNRNKVGTRSQVEQRTKWDGRKNGKKPKVGQ